ncbi:hypothetical protein Pint_21783 [Pistacia integerrima]|uniref:Uncharacterized protein n=1 Tax=Pistacia integerrima TaxID=434235 RepID=A0ACC0XAL1_9ROSI|nr:hypothetical protein Pint_21783 [Pistacia integerrima]
MTQTNFVASSPYALHASDNPGTTLVTCLLKEENYPTWHRAITNALQAKNKFGVAYFITAQEMWNDLEERFFQGNAPRIHQLKTEMVNTLQQGMSVSAYYPKLKGIWDELNTYSQIPKCTCGSACGLFFVEREKEKVHQFLMGLNEKYNTVRSQILNTKPLPSLSCVYGLVAQEERQQLVIASRLPSIEAAAFFSSNGNKIYNNHRSANNHDLSKLFCEHCKKRRRTKETCFELNGYPEWWDKGKKSSKPKVANSSKRMEPVEGNPVPINGLTAEQYAQLISMLNLEKTHNSTANFAGKAAPLSNCTIEWIVDLGLSHEEAD